ncbi:hypothetical protein [Pilimelia columellifera]|uniref:Protein phosphatase 2C domain-containing protein n=1 Tax=Pilimelia columellifera subsp. columellifera TaxID=706583 RepID=A0ABN3NRI8_9ACTN
MRAETVTDAGRPGTPNEDWALANETLLMALDGATVRTETGCQHGVPWYVAKLGASLTAFAAERTDSLGVSLTLAIQFVADQHRECDLSHPGTPSAGVGIVRLNGEHLEYLVLGDVTVIIDTTDGIQVISDDRVSNTATAERAEADRHPFGSAEKQAALLRMKHAELAVRNTEGGYWIAAADPRAATHAISDRLPLNSVRRVALLTDGATRAVEPFKLLDWPQLLDVLQQNGSRELINRVRAIEAADPQCTRWPRNKRSDDATAVFAA